MTDARHPAARARAARAPFRPRARHRRRDQRHRRVPRARVQRRRRHARGTRRLRVRGVGRVEPHDPRRRPLPRERRAAPGEGVGAGAQRAAAARPASGAPARDHDPDLLDLLRHPRGALAPAAPPLRAARRARRPAHQDRAAALRPVLARLLGARPGCLGTASAAAAGRCASFRGSTPASATRPPITTPRFPSRSDSRSTCCSTAWMRTRSPAPSATSPRCPPASRGSGCATRRPARSSTSPPTSS